jgi:hypothetical protein
MLIMVSLVNKPLMLSVMLNVTMLAVIMLAVVRPDVNM